VTSRQLQSVVECTEKWLTSPQRDELARLMMQMAAESAQRARPRDLEVARAGREIKHRGAM
jgi:hypothetical protein